MSRFCPSLGDVAPWYGLGSSPGQVYLWRARLEGVELREPADLLALVKAVGSAQDRGLDVRGATAATTPSGVVVDVVLTSRLYEIYPPLISDDAQDIADGVLVDGAVRARLPGLAIAAPQLLEITGPPAAVDFWRAHVVLWDYALGQGSKGGPTAAFADGQGIYRGASDAAPAIRPWTKAKPGLAPETDDDDTTTVLWVLGGAALLWLAARAWTSTRST